MTTTTPHRESALIRSAQEGGLTDYGLLVQRYYSKIRNWLAARVTKLHEADDLAQEAFITGFYKIRSCDPDRPLGPWLRGIAADLLANHQRKSRAVPAGLNEDLQELLDSRLRGTAPGGGDAVTEALHTCLEELDEPSRLLIRARYGEGTSVGDLASRLHRKESSISTQLQRLRVQLAAGIERKLLPDSASSGAASEFPWRTPAFQITKRHEHREPRPHSDTRDRRQSGQPQAHRLTHS